MADNRRIEELDALRGLAALAVMAHHYFNRFDSIYHHAFAVPEFTDLGRYGVHLFFMISGFVILMTLERTRRPCDFLFARFSRLHPAYWVCVLMTFTLVQIFSLPGRETNVPETLVNLTMLQGFFQVSPVDGVYWSLKVELCFYGILFLLFVFGRLRHLMAFCGLWLACSLAYFGVWRGVAPEGQPVWLFQTASLLIFQYSYLFVLGIVFYRLFQKRAGAFDIVLAATAVAGCWVVEHKLSLLLLVIAFCGIFLLLCRVGGLPFLRHRILIYLGAISYTVYLLNQNIGYLIIRGGYKWGLSTAVSIPIAVVTSLVLASVVYYFVERPVQNWLRARYKEWTASRAAQMAAS